MMLFVPMDASSYCGTILSICFLLQSTTSTLHEVCYEQAPKKGIVKAEPTSESSIAVSWEFHLTPVPIFSNTTDGGISFTFRARHDNFTENLFDLVMTYQPCTQYGLSWPTLVRDPVTNIYLARYNVDESTFAPRSKSSSRGEFHRTNYFREDTNDTVPLASGMLTIVTDLPYPDWPYIFYLQRVMNDLSHMPARILGRTNPAPPKVCPGCFRTLWLLRSEQKRQVRVYWPPKVSPQGYFLMYVYEKYSNGTGAKLVHEREISIDRGYVDVIIGQRSHIFLFTVQHGIDGRELLRDSFIVVPDKQNAKVWTPVISTTITNTTTGIRTVSWEKPRTSEVIKYYTLVWYDKKKWRENPNRSPIMDWVYIRGSQTSIELRMVDSEGDDDERVGWRLTVHMETSKSEMDIFDDY